MGCLEKGPFLLPQCPLLQLPERKDKRQRENSIFCKILKDYETILVLVKKYFFVEIWIHVIGTFKKSVETFATSSAKMSVRILLG